MRLDHCSNAVVWADFKVQKRRQFLHLNDAVRLEIQPSKPKAEAQSRLKIVNGS
jgi:hypothetical protein